MSNTDLSAGLGGMRSGRGFTLHLVKPGTKRTPLCGAKCRLRWYDAVWIKNTKCKRCFKE